jgi:hypothetical protein
LKDWTTSTGMNVDLDLLDIFKDDPARFRLIMSTLIRIARLFADRKGLERGYDIKTAAGRNSTAKLRFDDIKLMRLDPKKKTTVIPPAETYTITDAELDLNLD